MTKSPHPSSVDKGELLPVTQADREIYMFARGIGSTDQRALIGSGHHDDEALMQRIARHRQAHSLPGDAPVILTEGFEAEQDGDTFTVRFPDGHAITARADGRLIVTKAEAGFVPLGVNVAALTPSAPEPVQKLHELPEGHRWCRHCDQKDDHCSVCEGVGYLPNTVPSALSEEQQWGGLLEDGLCDDHGQFMCPKCRYPVPSQQGTEP